MLFSTNYDSFQFFFIFSRAALGFYHMHTAANRNSFIRINWGNIKIGNYDNFVNYQNLFYPVKFLLNWFSPLYDYLSVMHYSAYAFSRNGQPTIEPIVSLKFFTWIIFKIYLIMIWFQGLSMNVIGQSELSASDVFKLKKLYECYWKQVRRIRRVNFIFKFLHLFICYFSFDKK